jgi:hypothetical protein
MTTPKGASPMSNEMTRREFLQKFLPPRRSFRVLCKAAKWCVLGLVAYIGIGLLVGLPVGLWMVILGVAVLVGIGSGTLYLYRRLKRELWKRRKRDALIFLVMLEKALTVLFYMTVGAVLYDTWLTDPSEVYWFLGLLLFAFVSYPDAEEIRQSAAAD